MTHSVSRCIDFSVEEFSRECVRWEQKRFFVSVYQSSIVSESFPLNFNNLAAQFMESVIKEQNKMNLCQTQSFEIVFVCTLD